MFNLTEHISLFLVFIEGIISFFSPCILPILPVYISYLSSNAKEKQEDGTIVYQQKKVFLYTLFFILGISLSFFILGFGFTALGSYFKDHTAVISKIGGILIIFLGLAQLGVFHIPLLHKERRIQLGSRLQHMSFSTAFLLGFTFSFAWTPCVGPALSSVLIMAGNASTTMLSIFYVVIYSIGFLIPFLLLGLFTTKVLKLFQTYQRALAYTIKAGGAILVIMGILMLTGMFSPVQDTTVQPEEESSSQQDHTSKQIPAYEFTLQDQKGNTHTLSQYKGKVIFLNFWATWCGYCKKEIPEIEEIYKEYGNNEGDVIILSVVTPGGREQDEEGIKDFIQENQMSYPVLLDDGSLFSSYQVYSLPTTFMIDKDGNIFGYLSGGIGKETMRKIIEQTKSGRHE